MRTIDWRHPATVAIVDQTRLPDELVVLELLSVRELSAAVRRLSVRGAPALGVAGALGVALAYAEAEREGWDDARLAEEIDDLRAARPTAVNLAWGVDEMLRVAAKDPKAVEGAALSLLDREVEACMAIGERGADLLSELLGGPLRLHTHCNTGALACVEWGTALGVVRSLHRRGLLRSVLVDETRPLLQGARLTAWELEQEGIEYRVVVDAAGPGLIAAGEVDAVVVGADRIVANGDVANKVGTYGLALAASRAGVPFIVAAPESTLDASISCGSDIPIEERDADEVLEWRGARVTPSGAAARNPAFDVTPAALVTAIVTEQRVIDMGTPGARAVTLA
jgi:methylthioribose-1-phosphate isomerase